MKNNKWPAPDEKPDAFVQKQKDDLEDIANTIFFAIDTPPINISKPILDRTNNEQQKDYNMEKPLCPSIDSVSDASPCLESYSGLTNRFIVVNQGDQEIDPEILQKIADEKNVSVSDIKVWTKEEYIKVVREAWLAEPSFKKLEELQAERVMEAPIILSPVERDDKRPWYNRFNKKRKGRR